MFFLKNQLWKWGRALQSSLQPLRSGFAVPASLLGVDFQEFTSGSQAGAEENMPGGMTTLSPAPGRAITNLGGILGVIPTPVAVTSGHHEEKDRERWENSQIPQWGSPLTSLPQTIPYFMGLFLG